MQLIDWLKKLAPARLRKIADQHGIYYQTDFSNLWLADKLQQKLLDKTYLQKIIKQQLNPQATNTIQQLLKTTSLAQTKVPPPISNQLTNWGLIYKKEGAYYLPDDIKRILLNNKQTNSTAASQPKQSARQNNSNLVPNIQIKQKAPLSFYDYLLLSLSYLQQNHNPQLTSYLQQINCSLFSTTDLRDKLFTYAQEFELLTAEKNITSEFETWLQSDCRKVLLQTLDFFFPNRQSVLRKITAVLIHYPSSEQLPLPRLNKEVTSLSLQQKEKQLLELINLFKFREQNLALTHFCWQLFNSEEKENFPSPQRKKEKTIVNLPTSRAQLWEVCTSQQLIEINKSLIFTTPNAAPKN